MSTKKYRVTSPSYIGNRLVSRGDIVELPADAEVGSNLEAYEGEALPADAEGEKADTNQEVMKKGKAGETLAKFSK